MKYIFLIILSSCVQQPPQTSPRNEEVQRGLQWLRIAQAYTEGCLHYLQNATKEDKKECHESGTKYANEVFPL